MLLLEIRSRIEEEDREIEEEEQEEEEIERERKFVHSVNNWLPFSITFFIHILPLV